MSSDSNNNKNNDDESRLAEQEEASCIQWPLFSWVSPLLARGAERIREKKYLEEEDLLRLPDFEIPEENAKHFDKFWEEELEQNPTDPKLGRVLRKAFGKRVYIGGAFRFMSDFTAFASPFLLRQFIRWLQDPDAPKWEGFVWGAAMTLANIIMSTCLNAGSHHTITGFQQMATALMIKVYDSALEHPISNDTGTLTNAHSVDTAKFIEMAMFVHGLWVSPTLVLAAAVALYFFIGWAGLIAVALMIVFIPIQSIFMGFIAKHMRARLGAAKGTIASVNEALQGIRICKFMNWEESFRDRIAGLRSKEVDALKNTYFFRSLAQTLNMTTPLLILFILFLVAAKLGEPITAENVFPTLAMINVIRVPMMFIPMSIAKLFELQFSIDRIQSVMMGKRKNPAKIGAEHIEDNENAIEVENVTVWTEKDKELMTFENVKVPQGKLTVVVGPTGSGKTTLVSTMLGEVRVEPKDPAAVAEARRKAAEEEKEKKNEEGDVEMKDSEPVSNPISTPKEEATTDEQEKRDASIRLAGAIAYVPQEPWLMNATVEKNIVLEEEYDRERYVEVLTSCQLLADMDQLPGGDETQVGERGITLSGGQKQRISLARAAYSHRDIVVMDDPLSAVDPHVRKGLFFNCISEWMKAKTRVLVTHQTQFLPHCDKIIHIDTDHKIVFQGNYQEYIAAGFAVEEVKNDEEEEDGGKKKDEPPAFTKKSGKALDSVEENVLGIVQWSVYSWYTSQGGWFWFIMVIFGLLIWRTATVFVDLWLTWWSTGAQPFGGTYEENDYIMWFGITIAIAAVALYIRMEFFRAFVIRVAGNTHNSLIKSLLHAPVSFYDTTPMGRILNRCSKDIDVMDAKITETLIMVKMMVFMIVGMVVIVGFTTPYFLILLPIIGILYRWIYNYYSYTVRGLKRLEGSLRSPFMTMMNETIGGLATIRAFGCTEQFSEEHKRRSKVAMRPMYCTRSCQRWIASRTEFLGSGILFVCAMLAAMSHVIGETSWNTTNSAGIIALAVTYASITTNTITWLTRMMAELEADMSSTERVKEYSDSIAQEATTEYGGDNPGPQPEWPTEGNIKFSDAKLRYRDDLPLVLKGIDVEIKGGEKVGVVGRTGSGKSTIMLALFRMVELAEGNITIDGFDIQKLKMNDLRKNITIIPQDPTLFAGTVRSNLDPFNQYDDEVIWSILDRVNLKKRVISECAKKNQKKDGDKKKGASGAASPASAASPKSDNGGKASPKPAGGAEPIDSATNGSPGSRAASPKPEETEEKPTLDAEVTEKGSNFSVGERQLMCLARALLKKSKILLLDEATASVDYEADELIQRTLREEFGDCTVLTIAHRLATVIDSNKILVLDEGLVAEFDSPKNLLENETSVFTSMAQQLGTTQFEDLKSKAK